MTTGIKVHEFLKKNQIPFDVVGHPKSETALRTALAERTPPEAFAKVVMIKLKGKDAMFVIPSNRRIDTFKLNHELNTDDLRIEEEREFQDLFTDCERGAMPPFGFLYGVPAYADIELENQKDIYFNAGSHEETINMATHDYLRFAEAEIGDYSVPREVF
jgi:Ala-tRNA(Pro) deacylase